MTHHSLSESSHRMTAASGSEGRSIYGGSLLPAQQPIKFELAISFKFSKELA
jgi:hypothetical protein